MRKFISTLIVEREGIAYLGKERIIQQPKPVHRKGLENAFQQMHMNGEGKLLINGIFEDEILKNGSKAKRINVEIIITGPIIMTEKQILRAKAKIDKYKKALAADKKYWGGYYQDGQGIRYAIPELYIQIKDYKGGLRYMNWFQKNFPDDSGDGIFFFEWTFILFQCCKLIEAEQKAHQTFFSNTYLFDFFLGKEPLHLYSSEGANWDYKLLVEYFTYTSKDDAFVPFSSWIESILISRAFLDKANEYIEIQRLLLKEPVGKKRSELITRQSMIRLGK